MFCKNCGTENNDDVKFCKKCGKPLTKETTLRQEPGAENNEGTTICKKCGTNNKEGTKYCKICGNPLKRGTAKKTGISKENNSNWYKTKRNKILAGVCAGLAEKYNINPWVLRIILIVSNLFVIGWLLDIAYVILIFLLKYDDEGSSVISDNTHDVSTKISSFFSHNGKKAKQIKDRLIEEEKPEELFSHQGSYEEHISPKSANESSTEEEHEESLSNLGSAETPVSSKPDFEPSTKEEREKLFSHLQSADILVSSTPAYEPSAEEEDKELISDSESAETPVSSKPDFEPSAEKENKELVSDSESPALYSDPTIHTTADATPENSDIPDADTAPVKAAASVVQPDSPVPKKSSRVGVVVLVVLLTLSILTSAAFAFLYFSKRHHNETGDNIAATNIPFASETEAAESVTLTEAEAEPPTQEQTETMPPTESSATEAEATGENDNGFESYTIQVISRVRIYPTPRYYMQAGETEISIIDSGVYTIVEEYTDEMGTLWGKLKSGAGWIDIEAATTNLTYAYSAPSFYDPQENPSLVIENQNGLSFTYSRYAINGMPTAELYGENGETITDVGITSTSSGYQVHLIADAENYYDLDYVIYYLEIDAQHNLLGTYYVDKKYSPGHIDDTVAITVHNPNTAIIFIGIEN